MNESTLKNLCNSVRKGETRFVENTQTHHAGKAISCNEGVIEVDIYGKRENWPSEECKEFEGPDFNYHR